MNLYARLDSTLRPVLKLWHENFVDETLGISVLARDFFLFKKKKLKYE